MSTLVMKHFDLLNFVQKSKELGVPELVAEFQGRQLEEAIEIAVAASREVVDERSVATQQDLIDYKSVFKGDFKGIDVRLKNVEIRLADLEVKIKELEYEIKSFRKDVHSGELRLEVKIEQARNQVVMWMVGLLFAGSIVARFLH